MNYKQKKELHKLRVSWKDCFSDTVLLNLDIAMNKLDRGWPCRTKHKVKQSDPIYNLILSETCKEVS